MTEEIQNAINIAIWHLEDALNVLMPFYDEHGSEEDGDG